MTVLGSTQAQANEHGAVVLICSTKTVYGGNKHRPLIEANTVTLVHVALNNVLVSKSGWRHQNTTRIERTKLLLMHTPQRKYYLLSGLKTGYVLDWLLSLAHISIRPIKVKVTDKTHLYPF